MPFQVLAHERRQDDEPLPRFGLNGPFRTLARRQLRRGTSDPHAYGIQVDVRATKAGLFLQASGAVGGDRFSKDLLKEAGVDVSSVFLISKPYEERHTYATARKLWPEVEIISASTPITLDEYVDSIGDARLVIDMLVGALQRLPIYPEQGFMISQPVPEDVMTAYVRLRQHGFTSRLVTTDTTST